MAQKERFATEVALEDMTFKFTCDNAVVERVGTDGRLYMIVVTGADQGTVTIFFSPERLKYMHTERVEV